MTRPYWRRRTSRRLSALGLILSLGLILTANGYIKATTTQQEPVSVECAEPATVPPTIRKQMESPSAPSTVKRAELRRENRVL